MYEVISDNVQIKDMCRTLAMGEVCVLLSKEEAV
jgi:hypothetical protein